MTLLEMTVVLAVVALISTVVLPRVWSGRTQERSLFVRQVIQGLRYAQKMAMASQCPVQFGITSTSSTVGFALTRLPNPQTGGNCGSTNTTLNKPDAGNTTTPYSVTVSTAAVSAFTMSMQSCQHPQYTTTSCAVVSTPTTFYFDHKGRPRDSSQGYIYALTLTVGGKTITVYPETGFVQG